MNNHLSGSQTRLMNSAIGIPKHRKWSSGEQRKPVQPSVAEPATDTSLNVQVGARTGPIRMLRLAQVIDVTGLGKTKIYALQGEGNFPMRVKITARSVAWVEEEVQTWLAKRIATSPPLPTP